MFTNLNGKDWEYTCVIQGSVLPVNVNMLEIGHYVIKWLVLPICMQNTGHMTMLSSDKSYQFVCKTPATWLCYQEIILISLYGKHRSHDYVINWLVLSVCMQNTGHITRLSSY